MKIAFLTLGCKLNFAETATYRRGFENAGLEVVSWREKADIYLVNTCTVTSTADAKSRSEIRKVHRINPDAKIIVTGCYAALKPDEVRSIEGVSRVFTVDEKNMVVSETLSLAAQAIHSAPQPMFPAYSTAGRTRSFLKVQDGCDNFCAYCTVPYARGRSRNLPVSELVGQAETIASKGIKEIVITGVNTGDFGRSTGETFLSLLQALDKVEGIERYRISSIEPNLLGADIIDWIASGDTKFQPHFHIPLQTGSDELLRTMGRKYDTAFFAGKVAEVRRAMEAPGKERVFFGIDVICGLPGESDAMFEETCSFLEEIRPSFIHVFPYSRRPGTAAAAMGGQVDVKTRDERAATLQKMCASFHDAFVAENRGIRSKVLWESENRSGMMGGYTANYIRKETPWKREKAGTIEEVTI